MCLLADQVVSNGVWDILPISVILSVSDLNALDKCSFCMEMYCIGDEIIWLPCFHAFHHYCFLDWIYEVNNYYSKIRILLN
ncbi:unnamed protein product [Heterobilharzia americana]|nr:unnamed protein product [Heterobilharzia americana]